MLNCILLLRYLLCAMIVQLLFYLIDSDVYVYSCILIAIRDADLDSTYKNQITKHLAAPQPARRLKHSFYRNGLVIMGPYTMPVLYVLFCCYFCTLPAEKPKMQRFYLQYITTICKVMYLKQQS